MAIETHLVQQSLDLFKVFYIVNSMWCQDLLHSYLFVLFCFLLAAGTGRYMSRCIEASSMV